jgi:hypothetical protein
MTGFLQFFSVSVWLFGYFLLWLTGHGHSLSKTGPKTMTRLDLKALVSKGFGLNVKDNVSARAVGHIMHEGGVAAQIQLVHKAENAKGSQFPFHGPPYQYTIITTIT